MRHCLITHSVSAHSSLNPEPQHPQDIDLLEYSISKWLEEMGVKKYEIYKTDLPSNTARDIKRFLQAR